MIVMISPELMKSPAIQNMVKARSICDKVYGSNRLKQTLSQQELVKLKTDGCTKAVLREVDAGATMAEAERLLRGTAGKGFLVAGAAAGVALIGLGWWLGGRR